MEPRDQAWWLGLTLVGMAATLAIGYMLRGRFPVVIDKNELEVITAFGTLAAVFVALFLGLRSDADKRAERRGRSELAAALIDTDLGRFVLEVKELKTQVVPHYFLGVPRNVPPNPALENKLMSLSPQDLQLYYEVHPRVGVSVARSISKLRSFEEWRRGTHAERDKSKLLSMRPLDEAYTRWATEYVLEAYAELRSAENIVRRVLEEVQSPKWHFVDPEED